MANTLISKITAASRVVGALAADKTNTAQNYKYISADKILERAGDALADNGVAVLPAINEEATLQVEYTDSYGKAKMRFDALVRFTMFVTDGETQMELPWVGRGSDFSVPDKALYKAITSGHKYFLMKLLNVGVGNEDGEHEAEAAQDAQTAPQRTLATPAPKQTQPAPKTSQGAPTMPRQATSATPEQVAQLDALGSEFYAEEWGEQRGKLCRAASKGSADAPADLLQTEIAKLIEGISKKMAEVSVATAQPIPH
jgi:hypothetical protein